MGLEARNLSFQYDNGNRKILNNVSMYLDGKDRLGLMAPSGFGKTTFCKILAGYEKPDSGKVLVDGKPIASFRGYCPVQMIWQHPELSVNPRLKMKETIKEGRRVERRVLEGLGIETSWLNRYPGELSGAMLDLITQSQIWNFLLEEVKMRGIGLLVVSHSEPLVARVCNRKMNLEKNLS